MPLIVWRLDYKQFELFNKYDNLTQVTINIEKNEYMITAELVWVKTNNGNVQKQLTCNLFSPSISSSARSLYPAASTIDDFAPRLLSEPTIV